MSFPWSTLLSDLTTATKSFRVPYPVDITSMVDLASYVGPVSNNQLKSPNLAYLKFSYPLNGTIAVGLDNAVLSKGILVGFQIQILNGNFSESDCNPKYADDVVVSLAGEPYYFRSVGRPFGDTPPGSIVYESTVQTIRDDEELLQAANLASMSTSLGAQLDIPNDLLARGNKYTARVRAILVYPDDVEDFGQNWYLYNEARPYYTRWGIVRFSVNQVPSVVNMTSNGEVNPTGLSLGATALGFTINDIDGPSYLYRLQVGTFSGSNFTPNIWDTGIINGGSGTGSKDFAVVYAGPTLSRGVQYYWRVKPDDSLNEGLWSEIASFKFNSKPTVSAWTASGSDILGGLVPTISSSTPVIAWNFSDADGGTQKAYSFSYTLDGSNEEVKYTGKDDTDQIVLPTLPTGRVVTAKLSLSDGVDFSDVYVREFLTNATPIITNVLVDDGVNPVDVSTTTPTFSWTFQDLDPTDVQVKYKIQVATDLDFTDLVWDTGNVTSSSTSVVYGTTPSPVVAPVALSHSQGMYYFRIYAYDGVSWSGDDDSAKGFFAINTVPGDPTLTNPTSTAYNTEILISWTPASPVDADGDEVTYTIEYTTARTSNRGWTFLAGPFPQTQNSYSWDITQIPSGDNYGVRVIASDGFSESSPTALGTSPRFTIQNHAPNSPIIISPTSGQTVSQKVRVEWVEATPLDVDGDAVIYILEISSNANTPSSIWSRVKTYSGGTHKDIIDVSDYPTGVDYRFRIRTLDEHGAEGTTQYSGIFAISNESVATDFERMNGGFYVSTSDGRLYKAEETIWDFSEDWSGEAKTPPLQIYITPGATITKKNGEVIIKSQPGQSCILRHAPKRRP